MRDEAPARDNVIDSFRGEHAFLSNFYEGEPFKLKSETCRTAEHCYQAAKASDPFEQMMVLASGPPGSAKMAGRLVRLRPNWEDIKINVMRAVLRAKFSEGSDLASRLVATGDRYLIEGNVWGDKFWGCVKEGGTWVGQNNLGLLLMDRRQELGGAGRPKGWMNDAD
jgi:ribA/ribD-fused uncharacterized protein